MDNQLPRKPYTPPTLHVHGSIAQLTRQVRPSTGSETDHDFENLESSNATFETRA